MLEKLYIHRFSLFFISQLVILFGSLLIPSAALESVILSLFFIVNVLAGIVLVSKNKTLLRLFIGLLILMIINSIFKLEDKDPFFNYVKMGAYFLFYGIVTIQMIKQVWQAKIVNKNVILLFSV